MGSCCVATIIIIVVLLIILWMIGAALMYACNPMLRYSENGFAKAHTWIFDLVDKAKASAERTRLSFQVQKLMKEEKKAPTVKKVKIVDLNSNGDATAPVIIKEVDREEPARKVDNTVLLPVRATVLDE